MRIVVEGLIGAGKSTLLEAVRAGVRARGLPVAVAPEPVEAWQHLLGRFYADRDRWAFPLQMCVLDALLSQRDGLVDARAAVYERSHHSAVNVFGPLTLHPDELVVLRRWYDRAAPWRPDCVVFLDTSVETCLRRIAQRGRPGEGDVDADYLQRLRAAYDAYLDMCREAKIRTVTVPPEDSHRACDRVLALLADMRLVSQE